ncbi:MULTISPECIES: phosphate ABC transporter substrate-binding protein PstS [unclassified Pusillimonas]|uniref:phosphate ABC transporter substrate-binding protein PstS n=1 Tax=unclassified Pusillimonas TaxID=2640016 RepID=UPI000B9C942A|nr:MULTISPECIES: phosphate ABC transporter substrate-binding protein PstS [unclassified Pusillimonas]OXR49091.1 phosphate ABC transporter substrate-binding protein PstS [Pusillimonas sp. T2]ROT45972.1 phosphate ABC transporter substrate-binding protein PstS [Pusillimonas sp. NJUB218]
MFKRVLLQVSVGIAFGAASLAAHAADITGAGASFPYPIYAKWAAKYQEVTGNRVNYQSIGSGGGQQQIIAKTVDFGASDDPMKADLLEKHGLFQFPAIIGGTVPVINVDGVKPGELKLTPQVLADIFLAKITKWDDEAIKKINPDVKLPSASIVVVHRSDGSGTTFGWTNYLSKVSAEWKEKVGEGKAVKWPTGQGGKGNEGVAAYVRQLKNSIGYVEYAYAKQNNLSWTALQNKDGKFVQPSQEAFAAAAANADWKSAPGMGVVLTDEPGAESWPVTSASFILVHKAQDKPENAKEVLTFFNWAFENGASMAAELDYVPMPKAVTDQILAGWKTDIKAADGSAIWK